MFVYYIVPYRLGFDCKNLIFVSLLYSYPAPKLWLICRGYQSVALFCNLSLGWEEKRQRQWYEVNKEKCNGNDDLCYSFIADLYQHPLYIYRNFYTYSYLAIITIRVSVNKQPQLSSNHALLMSKNCKLHLHCIGNNQPSNKHKHYNNYYSMAELV